jgi:hypothetical protein
MTGSSAYLLRLRLPDRPGALGQVATALGAAGADIESIVVVDRADGFAVDDLLVNLPAAGLADKLVTAAATVDGVIVEAVQRHHGRMRVSDELALLDLAASSPKPLQALVDGLPELLHVSYALVAGEAGPAGSAAAPARVELLGWLPLAAPGECAADQLWHDPASAGPDPALIAVPFARTSALVLGRIGGPAFRPAEVMRTAHLANLAAIAVERLRIP